MSTSRAEPSGGSSSRVSVVGCWHRPGPARGQPRNGAGRSGRCRRPVCPDVAGDVGRTAYNPATTDGYAAPVARRLAREHASHCSFRALRSVGEERVNGRAARPDVGSRGPRRSPGGGQPRGRPAPGAGGQVPGRVPSADPGGKVPPADPDHRHTAEAARRRFPRPPLPVRGHCAGGALAAGPARG